MVCNYAYEVDCGDRPIPGVSTTTSASTESTTTVTTTAGTTTASTSTASTTTASTTTTTGNFADSLLFVTDSYIPVIRSELTLYKGCVNVANEGHSQYFEWPSLATFSQPFYSVNSLIIIHSNPHGSDHDPLLLDSLVQIKL